MITKPARRKLVKPRKSSPSAPQKPQTARAESAERKLLQGQGRHTQNMPLTQAPMGMEL